MNYTKNWGKSVERYKAFWQGEMLDRCCVSVTAPKRTLEPLPSFTSQETLEHWTDGEWVFKTWKIISKAPILQEMHSPIFG